MSNKLEEIVRRMNQMVIDGYYPRYSLRDRYATPGEFCIYIEGTGPWLQGTENQILDNLRYIFEALNEQK